MSSPLRGLRVLDLSRVLAGPWCTMLLGDAGASVVKLERPGSGDDTRGWGPPFLPAGVAGSAAAGNGGGGGEESVSTYFLSVNRSKRSVAVDLKRAEGRDICRRLATEWADVVVENFRVGTMEKLGLGYDSLRGDNPGLIYCSITGFGSTGPLRDRPGYDVIVSGMYGLMSITGEECGDPAKVGVAVTDVLTGTLAQGGILAALHRRHATGVGLRVEASLMEAQLAGLINIASSSLNAPPGTPPPKRWGTSHESIVPYQAFKCKRPAGGGEDQFVVAGAGNDAQFAELCRALDLPDVASDGRFRTNADRVERRGELIPILEGAFSRRTRDEWSALLDGAGGFAAGPVRTVPEAFACEQAARRGMVTELDHPAAGRIRLPRHPLLYSGSAAAAAAAAAWAEGDGGEGGGRGDDDDDDGEDPVLPPPMLGEHTEEILRDVLKVPPDELSRLEREGVVECWRRGDASSLDDS